MVIRIRCLLCSLSLLAASCFVSPLGVDVRADDPPAPKKDAPDSAKDKKAKAESLGPTEVQKTWTKVSRKHPLWIDLKKKEVIVGGRIALTRGQLEMFACPRGTKEHESVVAVDAPPKLIHAALLAVGARPGHPVRFEPKYEAAEGSVIDVGVVWKDDKGKVHRVRGQDLVRDVKTGKAMAHEWVFGGSGFWTDEETGKRYYYADGGEFICVSNFGTAMLDLPIRSSAVNDQLLFRAFSERIPPRGTRVWLVLRPKNGPKSSDKKDAKNDAKGASKQRGGGA